MYCSYLYRWLVTVLKAFKAHTDLQWVKSLLSCYFVIFLFLFKHLMTIYVMLFIFVSSTQQNKLNNACNNVGAEPISEMSVWGRQ